MYHYRNYYSPRRLPHVVLVSTDMTSKSEFERTQADFLEHLEERISVSWATTPTEVLDHFISVPLSNIPPLAMLLIDTSLLRPEYSRVMVEVRHYVRRGGKVITMWRFGVPEPDDHTHRLSFNNFFWLFGTGWTLDEHRTMQLVINPQLAEESRQLAQRLPPCFTLEGRCIRVYQEQHSCYTVNRLLNLTPIAYARIGRGCIGYVGDCKWPMNPRSIRVIEAMCHLGTSSEMNQPIAIE